MQHHRHPTFNCPNFTRPSTQTSMTSSRPHLLTLPDELLLRILYLTDWRSVTKLGQTCRQLSNIYKEPGYWRQTTLSTFPAPILPLIAPKNDWKSAFFTLLKNRVYGWGKNWNILFAECESPNPPHMNPHSAWAAPPTGHDYMAVVDIQSGGWCVVLLFISGRIVIGGMLDGATAYAAQKPRHIEPPVRKMRFTQISVGRSHLLALNFKGEVAGVRGSRSSEKLSIIKFVVDHYGIEYHPHNSSSPTRKHPIATRVVAGWQVSGCLTPNNGIFLWDDSRGVRVRRFANPDPRFVRRVTLIDVPGFSFPVSDPSAEYTADPIIDFTIGETMLLFITKNGVVYTFLPPPVGTSAATPLRLILPSTSEPPVRVNGVFRNFALMSASAFLYILSEADLKAVWASKTPILPLPQQPNFGTQAVIDVELGDYHALALTASGSVLSWGVEPQGCGALGQGPQSVAEKRGMKYLGNRDGEMEVPRVVEFGRITWGMGEEGTHWNALAELKGIFANIIGTAVVDETAKLREQPVVFRIAAGGWQSCCLTIRK